MIWELPTSLEVNGREWDIRTDYRDVLNVLIAFEDPDLKPFEKQYVCLVALYEDFDSMDKEDYAAAYEAAIGFIDGCMGSKTKSHAKTMDWEQDANLIFPAVNKVAGTEVRAIPYLHWWTFTGYFMEIHDSVFASVLSVRQKKAKGKKLEKNEEEFWKSNQAICVLKPKLSKEEEAEKERLRKLVGL